MTFKPLQPRVLNYIDAEPKWPGTDIPICRGNGFDYSGKSEFVEQWVKEVNRSAQNKSAAQATKEVAARQQISIDPFAELATIHNQMIRKAKI